MPIEILMPALSPTMTEGNLAKWLKKEGDNVKPGDVIAEIETDKATMEVEAVDEGVIGKIIIQEGTENVAVNKLIAVLLEEGETTSDLTKFIESANDSSSAAIPKTAAPAAPAEAQATSPAPASTNGRIFASPLAKRIAASENIDLKTVNGTGPHGRIIKADILEAANNPRPAPSLVNASFGRNPEEYSKIPNNNMRKVIAKRLCESKQTVPHFYLSVETKLDKLLAIRSEMNNATDKDKPAYKLSVNDFVIKASAMALKAVPLANASWSDEAILQYNNIDISVAVAIDGGLITPIIKNADQKSLATISNEMKDLAKRAREGKLAPHEFQGGGFSISNLGMYGIKQFNAIINPPQSCILAIGAGEEKAVVEKGEIKISNVMSVTLSCDHRVVDGAIGAELLKAFKNYIENPLTMLI